MVLGTMATLLFLLNSNAILFSMGLSSLLIALSMKVDEQSQQAQIKGGIQHKRLEP
jgi:hypothetical protein